MSDHGASASGELAMEILHRKSCPDDDSVRRFRVPGGWLYQISSVSERIGSDPDGFSLYENPIWGTSPTFVPDPTPDKIENK